jgi:hypothetical protein
VVGPGAVSPTQHAFLKLLVVYYAKECAAHRCDACRQSVESTRQYEMQRAANERLLEEKEALNRNLSELREEKSAVEQRLRNANHDLSKAKVLCLHSLAHFSDSLRLALLSKVDDNVSPTVSPCLRLKGCENKSIQVALKPTYPSFVTFSKEILLYRVRAPTFQDVV